MDSMKSKVSYLQGMIDGLSVDLTSKEGKIISAMVKVLDEMADKLDEIEYRQDHLEMYISTMDDDLQYVEEEFYGSDDTEDYMSEDNFIEYQCPRCGEMIYIDKAIVENNEEIGCPNCSYDLIGNVNEGSND
jgi:predicted RNA-binding Zn-ribbon protein involved in translation (DUF1610 family)